MNTSGMADAKVADAAPDQPKCVASGHIGSGQCGRFPGIPPLTGRAVVHDT
jgi:hypothetical protein